MAGKPTPKIKIYKDKSGEWRWTLVAKNGRILADSGEGYKRKLNCLAGALATLDTLAALFPAPQLPETVIVAEPTSLSRSLLFRKMFRR